MVDVAQKTLSNSTPGSSFAIGCDCSQTTSELGVLSSKAPAVEGWLSLRGEEDARAETGQPEMIVLVLHDVAHVGRSLLAMVLCQRFLPCRLFTFVDDKQPLTAGAYVQIARWGKESVSHSQISTTHTEVVARILQGVCGIVVTQDALLAHQQHTFPVYVHKGHRFSFVTVEDLAEFHLDAFHHIKICHIHVIAAPQVPFLINVQMGNEVVVGLGREFVTSCDCACRHHIHTHSCCTEEDVPLLVLHHRVDSRLDTVGERQSDEAF